MNYTLCTPPHDLFEPYIGKWYYLMSEIYLNSASFLAIIAVWLMGNAAKLVLFILRKIFGIEKEKIKNE